MHIRHCISFFVLVLVGIYGCRTNEQTSESVSADTSYYNEPFRPQLHFSPKANWMNDPNGLVYYKGVYHLFYQYFPDSTVWGPMHWGHATSKDLLHWTHHPIALYPDSLGLIFSGSAVVDQNNSSGFGKKENSPLVAMFTYHSQEKEKAGRIDYQYQGIAYSIDEGKTWTKYEKNPVIKNPGIKDFRDPKVFWHEQTKKWIVILAVFDHTEMWGSKDLKNWTKLSDFGKEYAAHGGVWECPDLFELKVEGEEKSKWIMLVSINPGGPNGGSATQYFVGDFDGTTFTSDTDKEVTSWLDFGPDNYAGVTWSNIAGGRKIFLGWMSNWAYAQEVPTSPWRSAMTIPRDLSLTKVGNRYFVKSSIAPEFYAEASNKKSVENRVVNDSIVLTNESFSDISKSMVKMTLDAKPFEIDLYNSLSEKLTIAFDQKSNSFIIDRSRAGKTNFSKNYPVKVFAPRVSSAPKISVSIVVDVASVEVFFDDGLTVMTSVFFTEELLSQLKVKGESQNLYNGELVKLTSIWK
jgi:fructan beta-fructosidase